MLKPIWIRRLSNTNQSIFASAPVYICLTHTKCFTPSFERCPLNRRSRIMASNQACSSTFIAPQTTNVGAIKRFYHPIRFQPIQPAMMPTLTSWNCRTIHGWVRSTREARNHVIGVAVNGSLFTWVVTWSVASIKGSRLFSLLQRSSKNRKLSENPRSPTRKNRILAKCTDQILEKLCRTQWDKSETMRQETMIQELCHSVYLILLVPTWANSFLRRIKTR